MAYVPVDLSRFAATFGTETELSIEALGGQVVAVSDEFFAEAVHLLRVEPSRSLKGQFGPKGALYDGWETRRHNPTYDWCIVKLGVAGVISGFDIDTSHFNGNEAPEASVEALFSPDDTPPAHKDARWIEVLPKVNLGPNARHLYQITRNETAFNYVKLKMYPDGGIARFRVYGIVQAIFPEDATASMDLAHVYAGGRVVYVSDQHFGAGSNVLLPGRGKDMGDGWETKRSRTPNHKDWLVIRLGEPGILEQTEIDTAHFMGNFPESCELHALYTPNIIPAEDSEWTLILPSTRLGPHRQHYFQLENVTGRAYSHVRLTIYPDGGVKRVRILGRRAGAAGAGVQGVAPVVAGAGHGQQQNGHIAPAKTANGANDTNGVHSATGLNGSTTPAPTSASPTSPTAAAAPGAIPALPLTPEAFAPFGAVLQAFASPHAAPRGTRVTPANAGTAAKFHRLARVEDAYPPALRARGAESGFSVYRCSPVDVRAEGDGVGWPVRVLERHPYTNQAFVPMGAGGNVKLGGEEDKLQEAGRAYLVVVARSREDGSPDLGSLRAFVANAGQGIVYDVGVWHHPMAALEKTIDFTCVETQIGDGSKADCEILELDAREGLPRISIPKF